MNARHLARATVFGVVALAGCDAAPRVTVGEPAPAYRGVTLDGDSTSLRALDGRVVLLNIWATWCEPCKEELPILQALYRSHAADGLEIVGVSVDAEGEDAKVRGFMSDYGLTYTIWLDPTERVSATFLAVGVPASYLIGRDGTLLWKKVGPIRENDPELGRLLDSALALPRRS